jgi:UDP-glucose 4-epimerase
LSARLVWVLGSGGLLGSHLVDHFSQSPEVTLWTSPQARFTWLDPAKLLAELEAAAAAFADAISSGEHSSWVMLWAAGAGIVGTSAAELDAETEALGRVLERLAAKLPRDPHGAPDRPGCVFLASSAGGVYGQCAELPATESSPLQPRSDYGRQKIRQEQLVARWAAAHSISCLIARISNLYGPGQNLRKPQGLISHLARNLILNRPVQVYVPLDTVRDYIHAADCARTIVASVARLFRERALAAKPLSVVKIFASEQPTCIAVLLGIFSRIGRRRPRIIQATSPHTRLQPSRLSFRTQVWPETSSCEIGLPAGVMETYQYMLARYQRGQLG